MRKFRGLLALIVAVLYIFFIFGFLGFVPVCLAAYISRQAKTTRRKWLSSMSMWHGNAVFWLVKTTLGFRVTFDLPTVTKGTQLIVISNHMSTIDIALMYGALYKLGIKDLRWVLKSEIRRYPFIGWNAEMTGGAFVTRKDPALDLRMIHERGQLAHIEDGSMLIFPEGTRFKGTVEGSGLKNLRPPKVAGFNALVEEMPEATVLSLTLKWDEQTEIGKTIADGAGFHGRTLRISGKLIDRAEILKQADWLDEHWKEKDKEL